MDTSDVLVPDYYFKALLISVNESYSAIAFVMENGTRAQDLSLCACTIDELERVLDKDLFCLLDNSKEKRIESRIVWEDWGLKKPLDFENYSSFGYLLPLWK